MKGKATTLFAISAGFIVAPLLRSVRPDAPAQPQSPQNPPDAPAQPYRPDLLLRSVDQRDMEALLTGRTAGCAVFLQPECLARPPLQQVALHGPAEQFLGNGHEQGTGRFSRFGRDAEIVIPERENEAVPSLPEKFSYGFVAAKPFGPRQSVLRHVNPSLNQHPYADILRHAPPSGMYAKLQKRDRPAKRHTLLPNSLSVSGSRPYYACFAFLSAGACSGLRGRALRPGFTSCAFRNSAALPLPFTTTGESSWPLFILPM